MYNIDIILSAKIKNIINAHPQEFVPLFQLSFLNKSKKLPINILRSTNKGIININIKGIINKYRNISMLFILLGDLRVSRNALHGPVYY